MRAGMAMRIAINDLTSAAWSGGGAYTEMLVRTLRRIGGSSLELILFTNTAGERWQGLARTVSLPLMPRPIRYIRRRAAIPRWKNAAERHCAKQHVSALLFAHDMLPGRYPFRRIAWIPDFQHRYLPQYFSASESAERDMFFEALARRADHVVLSSQAAFDDFRRFLPQYAAKGRIARFPSLYALTPVGDMAIDAAAQYGLPEKFVLVANQYWAHKNHALLVEAVARLAKQGLSIPVACTGLPLEIRGSGNAATSALLQLIARRGLAGQIIPLGQVPRAHLTDLMRRACLIVQPSRFEGWSTVVQDALALGRPLLCSDIPVHREQAPNARGFFDVDDPSMLADMLRCVWPTVQPGIDLAGEREGIARQQELITQYGQTVLDLCRI